MAKKRTTSRVVWLRRAVQSFFFVLFFFVFLQATFHPENQVGPGVTLFFDLDPLVLFVAWLGSSPMPRVMLLALVTLGVTLLLGRWFCGWVCPFGVLHNILTSRRGRTVKVKLQTGTFSPRQRLKYYLLIAFLVGALLGVNLIGWLDPFSFFYRSLATAVYPALNFGANAVFTWIYNWDPGWGEVRLTQVSEPVYEILRSSVLAIELQPQYQWSLLVGLLFLAVVALNLYRARFWCRYLCPLGALLGLAGKNPLLKLKKNESRCNDCRLCVADCPGGANPHSTGGWKPSECFYCWNCRSACPHDALQFKLDIRQKGHEETAA
ncbi:MAG: 4Fe-4S binding protein [Acidobacteriota bacterium]